MFQKCSEAIDGMHIIYKLTHPISISQPPQNWFGQACTKDLEVGEGESSLGNSFRLLRVISYFTPQTFFLLTNLAAIVDFGFQFLPNK